MNNNALPKRTLEYQRDEHGAHLVVDHLIGTPQRRHPALTDRLEAHGGKLIEQEYLEKPWYILAATVQPNLLHPWVRGWPTDAAVDGVKECEGITADKLRKTYPAVLKKLPSLWMGSYFASTIGNHSPETIKQDIVSEGGM